MTVFMALTAVATSAIGFLATAADGSPGIERFLGTPWPPSSHADCEWLVHILPCLI